MADFSDPAWWPKPPPRPATPIWSPTAVVRALFPLLAVAAVVAFVLSRPSHPSQPVRSVAAFERCLRARVRGQPAGEQRPDASHACQGLLPAGTDLGDLTAPSTPQARFDACVQNATANLPHGGFGPGGNGRGPSAVFRAAVAVCQSLVRTPGSAAAAPGSHGAPAALPKV